MPTYLQDLDYSIHAIKSVTHQLKVVEDIDIANNRSALIISIVRNNSSDVSEGGREYLTLEINGETVFDRAKTTSAPPANSSDEVFKDTYYIPHNASGGGTFTVSVKYKCDCIEGWGNLSNIIYYTIASAEITASFTPIDRTAPTISDVSISADRYGENAFVSFKASHSSYHLKEVEFKLNSMTEQQAKCRDLWYDAIRNGEIENPPTYVNKNYNGCNAEGDWCLQLYRVYPIGQEAEFYYPLDDVTDNLHPLESGKSYFYEIYATCINNVGIKIEGYLNVPQKVTGVTCDEHLDLVSGQSIELDYIVSPINAEDSSVTITSSDLDVADVTEDGVITAKSEGACIITVTTLDGGAPDATSGFIATCSVNVQDTSSFPLLTTVSNLSTVYLNRIFLACKFVREELIIIGASVAEIQTISLSGKTESVTNIKSLLEATESNCQILREAAELMGISTSLPSTPQTIHKKNLNWYVVVNNWINFLNELHSKVNGG